MGYSIELKNISIKDYKEVLRSQNLLPGRRILQDNIDKNFEAICLYGIVNLDELYKSISKPQKLELIANKIGLSVNYLTILKREIGSFIQKPILISDFPEISSAVQVKLSEHSIKTSKDLYDLSQGFSDMRIVCENVGISENDINELFSLCDLVRINGVGAVFARILYISGLRRAKDFVTANADELLEKFLEVNKDNKYTKAKLGKRDMQFCIDFAKIMSRV
ncbi:UNVERIFIED_CONTAM: uncharacterized protein DUF4332 [Acetivibrio alkalicellulosi]